MVLNYTSGLPNWASGPLVFDASPGTKWRYSGEGFVLLQRAVEAVTGEPLDRYMAHQLFAPLAMDNSAYLSNAHLRPQLLAGTKANGAPRSTIDIKHPVAAFSLHTTAADYGKFIAALLNDEPILKQLGASPVMVDAGLNLRWGLGWGVGQAGDDAYIWQWGNNPGYRAFVMLSVRTGDGFVMRTNSENGLAMAQPLAQIILPGEHKLFEAPMLEDDVLNLLLKNFHVCL